MKNLKDYDGEIIRKERMQGKLVKQHNSFKFARPFQVYLGFIKPFKGREVIYRQGWNDGELKVHKGSFPDINLNLDPRGSTAMKRSHHPITEFGFENTIRLISKNLRRAVKNGTGDIRISNGGELFGRKVWKIEVRFPMAGRKITVKEDETLWDVARRTGQDMYWILYSNQNKGWEDPDDVDEGDQVFVPWYYGAKAEFFLDKENGLPVKLVTLDRKGRLYESYEYPRVRLNPGLTAKDFDPDNEQYDF
ncbi:MAG: DUF1571 domain-containing protein [Deltaproteobacteria bacterium]|nr:DUF1571 domain-containing protein [Deltaproteobacteria bacterium]